MNKYDLQNQGSLFPLLLPHFNHFSTSTLLAAFFYAFSMQIIAHCIVFRQGMAQRVDFCRSSSARFSVAMLPSNRLHGLERSLEYCNYLEMQLEAM